MVAVHSRVVSTVDPDGSVWPNNEVGEGGSDGGVGEEAGEGPPEVGARHWSSFRVRLRVAATSLLNVSQRG